MAAERAYAKVNYCLNVSKKRPNGYHDLVTVMQTVSLFDTVTLAPRGDGRITLKSDMGGDPEQNLALRAARAYFAGTPTCGYTVALEKRIPVAAGLGGGSADAAAVLRALNKIEKRYTPAELAAVALTLGADVPFCLVGGTCLCEGVGEIMTPAANNVAHTLVVAAAGEGVSTPAAFAALDASRTAGYAEKPAPSALLSALEQGDLAGLCRGLDNDFEPVILPLRPLAAALKQTLLDAGACAALMSGSGPAVFGLFADKETAEKAAKRITSAGQFAAVAAPVGPF